MDATVRLLYLLYCTEYPTSRRKTLTRGPGPEAGGQRQEVTARNWEAMYGALLGFCRGFVLLGWAGLQCPPCIFARCVGARVKPLPLKKGSEQSLSLGWLTDHDFGSILESQACGAYRQGPSRLVPRLTSARSNYKLSTTILKTGLPSTKTYAL
jgi:hypothetical protein